MYSSGQTSQFPIRMQPPTSLIPLAVKALFCQISHDLKAVWDQASVYCENVCMCERGFLVLRGITRVCFLGLDKIRMNIQHPCWVCALCTHKPAAVCCHSVWFTVIHCTMWVRCGAMPWIGQPVCFLSHSLWKNKLLFFFIPAQNIWVNIQEEVTFKQPQHVLVEYFPNPLMFISSISRGLYSLKHTLFLSGRSGRRVWMLFFFL